METAACVAEILGSIFQRERYVIGKTGAYPMHLFPFGSDATDTQYYVE
jgi:hypothetical protein